MSRSASPEQTPESPSPFLSSATAFSRLYEPRDRSYFNFSRRAEEPPCYKKAAALSDARLSVSSSLQVPSKEAMTFHSNWGCVLIFKSNQFGFRMSGDLSWPSSVFAFGASSTKKSAWEQRNHGHPECCLRNNRCCDKPASGGSRAQMLSVPPKPRASPAGNSSEIRILREAHKFDKILLPTRDNRTFGGTDCSRR